LTPSSCAFDQLFEHATDPAFVLDPLEDRFLAANPAGCAVLGYTLEELLVTPVSRIHPGELTQLQELVGDVLRDGRGSTIKLTCRTSLGEFLPTEMSLWTFEDDGRVCVLALVRDRSEHRGRRLVD
jgi:two-component system, chemotaxis family, sensor kinase Cph1